MNSPPTARELNLCLCHTCGQPCDMRLEPTECDRCGAPLHRRKVQSLTRTWAYISPPSPFMYRQICCRS